MVLRLFWAICLYTSRSSFSLYKRWSALWLTTAQFLLNGLEFNQVSYSHHGVYFCLDTEQGKYRTQTEPNKLGFRIAEKYDLNLTKYQTGKDKLVPGATYSVTEITTNEGGQEERGES